MTQYISSDTNIWIDFAIIDAIHIPFCLDCEYLMYRDSFESELLSPPWLKERLINLGIRCIDIELIEFDLSEQISEKYRQKHLSAEDCVALAIAKNRKITLMTGDKHLREAAECENVKVIGTIGVLDWGLREGHISTVEYVRSLTSLRDNPVRRLPREALESRIRKYSSGVKS